jgi:hypothetical protein
LRSAAWARRRLDERHDSEDGQSPEQQNAQRSIHRV